MSLSRKSHEAATIVSQPLVFDLPPSETSSTVKIIDPAGNESQAHVSGQDGRKAVLVTSADLPGIYQMLPENGGPPLKLAVNIDPAESMTAVLDGRFLDELAASLSLGVVDAQTDLGAALRANRHGREIWRHLILAALALLVLEAIFSKWLVRRAVIDPDQESRIISERMLKSR